MQVRKAKTEDMTEGSLFKNIIWFAVPMCLGLLFQQLYNLADTIIVGRMLGVNALAGVGSTTGLTFLALNVATSLGNGFAVSISQRFGASDAEGVKKYFGNAISLAAILSIAFTFITVLLAKPVLTLVQTPVDIYAYAYDYVNVIFLGLPTTIFYNLLAASLRGLGDSRTPLEVLIVSSIVNIVLDVTMIGLLKMGVSGAALATVISQLISVIILLVHIAKRNESLKICKGDLYISRTISGEQFMLLEVLREINCTE